MPCEGRASYNDVECKLLYDRGSKGIVVFLHGYSFRGATWYEAGIAGEVASRGYTVAAPDMPYGRSSSCTRKTKEVDVNLGVIDRIVTMLAGGNSRPVLVGASLGGRIALYYALRRNVAGLYLAAPFLKIHEDPLWDMVGKLRGVPTVIVWGTRDRIVPRRVVERIATSLGGDLVVYQGAGHAAYLDRPQEFTRGLLSFLDEVMGSR